MSLFKRWIGPAFAIAAFATVAQAQDILIPTMPLRTVPTVAPGTRFAYSYPAAFPGPARVYVPYGANDGFTFTGQPYGHAYDRFTFSNLGGTNLAPVRYFYPPLR